MCEPESTAEAEVAGSTISTAAAGVPLGESGFSHTSWPSTPPPGLAEVSTALPQTTRTWLWVWCTQSLWSSSNQENSRQSLIWRYHISFCMCFIYQAGCRWMYWPKVLSGFFTGHSAQKPETKDTGGVWLPPYCQSGPQSSPTTHAFIRQPGWWQPW